MTNDQIYQGPLQIKKTDKGLTVSMDNQLIDGRPTAILTTDDAHQLLDALQGWADGIDASGQAKPGQPPPAPPAQGGQPH